MKKQRVINNKQTWTNTTALIAWDGKLSTKKTVETKRSILVTRTSPEEWPSAEDFLVCTEMSETSGAPPLLPVATFFPILGPNEFLWVSNGELPWLPVLSSLSSNSLFSLSSTTVEFFSPSSQTIWLLQSWQVSFPRALSGNDDVTATSRVLHACSSRFFPLHNKSSFLCDPVELLPQFLLNLFGPLLDDEWPFLVGSLITGREYLRRATIVSRCFLRFHTQMAILMLKKEITQNGTTSVTTLSM